MMVYLLMGEEEYEDTYELGIFETLEAAIAGRQEYRRAAHAPDSTYSDHHRYVVYEFELNQLYSPTTPKAVDRFSPSKTKVRK